MKKIIISIVSLLILLAAIWFGSFYYKNLRGVGPAVLPPKNDIRKSVNNTGLPLQIPDGFMIEIIARAPGARMLAGPSAFGDLWVSQTSQGQVSAVDVEIGKGITDVAPIFKNLKRPHGVAVDPQDPDVVYIAEEDKIVRHVAYADSPPIKIADLPGGGGHFTRTLKFGPDDRLYVSIGSSCNVCLEKDQRRAAIYSMNRDGTDFKKFAEGLRNTVFFAWSYVDGRMWGTDMGRDLLGDDLPPDEINIIEEGKHYGWPYCYGGKVHDLKFEATDRAYQFCETTVGSHVDIPAHSAPLGLAFVPEEGWPEDYWYDLLVAYHGSWNRSAPTGYKVVRLKLDARGNFEGLEDFITGWLTPEGKVLGRPVDILVQPGGVMYISDDKAGVIYKVSWQHQN